MDGNDIAARLREFESVPTTLGFHGLAQLMNEAADEIERLRAELRTYTGDGHNTEGTCTSNTPS